MAKQFVLTEDELNQLVNDLELTKLRMKEYAAPSNHQPIDEMHRAFHHRVVRWVQDVAGLNGR